MEPAREVAELLAGQRELLDRLVDERGGLGVVEPALQRAQQERDRDDALLGPVVEGPAELRAGGVAARHEPGARFEQSLELVVHAPTVLRRVECHQGVDRTLP